MGEENNQGQGGENQGGQNNSNNQNNNQGGQGGGDGQNQGGQGEGGGQGEKVEAIKNSDGTITIGGKKFIDNDSYEVIAEKQRKANQEKEQKQQEEKEAEEKRLAEQGKFEELAKSKDKKIQELEGRITREKKVNALQAEATKLGAVDLDAVVKLANLEDVKLAEDGSVDLATVSKAVETLKTQKTYLFGEAPQGQNNIGGDGGAPNGGNSTTPTFKRSQLRDHEFYKENEKAILQAQSEGKIIDDLS